MDPNYYGQQYPQGPQAQDPIYSGQSTNNMNNPQLYPTPHQQIPNTGNPPQQQQQYMQPNPHYNTGVPPSYAAPPNQFQQQQQQPSFPFGLSDLNSQIGRSLIDSAASRFLQGQRDFLGPDGVSGLSSSSTHFFKIPKYYFLVSNKYVLSKLSLLLFPFQQKRWTRRKLDASSSASSHHPPMASHQIIPNDILYLPPNEDINAPDLYIPVMAFVSYVLLVGLISGTAGKFTPDVMASTATLGLFILALEVLVVRFGLFLVKSKSISWFDIIAYHGYKFVGLIVVLLSCSLVHSKMYYPVLLFTASMFGVFLMKSYRGIVLTKSHSESESVGSHFNDEQTKKNVFLLSILCLQYCISWILAVRVR